MYLKHYSEKGSIGILRDKSKDPVAKDPFLHGAVKCGYGDPRVLKQ